MKLSLAFIFSLGTFFVNGYEPYEIWACDQSNTVSGMDALGIRGSQLWVWDDKDVKKAMKTGETPLSKSCTPDAKSGPCNMLQMFPGELVDSVSGETLSDSGGFGRWHGVTADPQNLYVTANIFAPNGGYLGIVDAETKGAVGLFRVSEMTYSTGDESKTTRNVHMSFWNSDGSAIIIHNLAGKAVERINVERDNDGKITSLVFDKSATVGVGKSMEVASPASFYKGKNAFGVNLLGGMTGSYDDADLGDFVSSSNKCKENGCSSEEADNDGRPNNVPICPVMAPNGLVFNTFGGGGLLVMDSKETPMSIVASYPNSLIYGAGVCGETVGDMTYFTSGVSASGAGVDQSMWTLFAFDYSQFDEGDMAFGNNPDPQLTFEFPGTSTGGRTEGEATDVSGQNPESTTRRDAHDLAGTVDGKYVHVIDRVKNVIDVFETKTNELVGEYSLRTKSGAIDDDNVGACYDTSVMDVEDKFSNDPAADFISPTPDGKYMMISLRGPAPVSASHAAQGSCPGVGIIELKEGGASGALIGVLRTENKISDTLESISPPGGFSYSGKERSDIHDVVVIKTKNTKLRKCKQSTV